MNAKHLFLTLAAIVVCSVATKATEATDAISFTSVTDKGYGAGKTEDAFYSVADWSFTSAAKYASSQFWYGPADNSIGIGASRVFASTTQGAKDATVKSVTINWTSEEDNTNLDGSPVKVYVYGRNGTPFSGDETLGSMPGTRVHIFTYGDGVTTYDFTENYEYVALVAKADDGAGAYLTNINITWQWEEIVMYSVSEGTITVDGASIIDGWGKDVTVTPESAAEGDIVTVTFAPKTKKVGKRTYPLSLVSYGLDDMLFDLSCTNYIKNPETYTITFPMPARNVTIDAAFEIVNLTATVIQGTEEETVQSGVEKVISFKHLIDDDTPTVPVTDYVGKITAVSSEESVAYVDNIVKVSDGNYTCTVHGLAAGDATITITAAKAGRIDEASHEITIHVEPRQAALVAEADGRYFVAKNTLVGGKFETIEVFKNGDKYLYSGSFAPSEVTWYISTLNSDGSEYSVQNADEQFLAPTGLSFKFQNDKFTWYDDDGRYQDAVSYNYIAYNTGSTKFTMGNYAAAAMDVLLSAFYPMTYNTSSSADAGIVDARNIKSTYGTICVPFDVASSSVASSGATFYTIDSKIVSGSSLGGIMLSEPHTALVAGHSYIYEMKEGVHVINFTGSGSYLYNAEDIADDGLVGSLVKDGEAEDGVVVVPGKVEPKSDGNYVLSSDQLRYVKISPEATVQQTIKAFRAYIAASEISAGAPAPGRKMIVCEGAEGVVTDIVDIPDALIINWNEPVYNIMGMRVGKGATGVLIQNGQKFFVQ